MVTSQLSFEEEMIHLWDEFEDSSNLERCYIAVMATSKSSKITVKIGALLIDNTCGYLKVILGGCPGTKKFGGGNI